MINHVLEKIQAAYSIGTIGGKRDRKTEESRTGKMGESRTVKKKESRTEKT